MFRRAFAFFLLLTLAADETFGIGVPNDQSGPYADLSGPGGAESARMAVEDFGGSVLGEPIELLVADHQDKVDVGLAVARQWYGERGGEGDCRQNSGRRRVPRAWSGRLHAGDTAQLRLGQGAQSWPAEPSLASASTQTEGTGIWASFSKIALAKVVHTNGRESLLWAMQRVIGVCNGRRDGRLRVGFGGV
jgi:Periplasmic binding protein